MEIAERARSVAAAPPKVTAAQAAEREKLIQAITLGFSSDPMCRWVWPEAKTYLEAMPRFVASFESAYYVDGYKAAALWLPPGVIPDGEAIGRLIETTIPPERADDAASIFMQMGAYHPTDAACWYLPLIAADPAFIGQGLGGFLMKHALRRCDEAGAMAYLESTNSRNLPLYERHGFEVTGRIQAGSSPTLYPMIRQARSV